MEAAGNKSLIILRRQRDIFYKQYGTPLQILEKKRQKIINGTLRDKNVVFSFVLSATDKQDANEYRDAIVLNENIHAEVEQQGQGFFIKTIVDGYKASELTKEKYFQVLGSVFYYALEYFCEVKNFNLIEE